MAAGLKVLVGCEFSGIVRRAFRDRGHNAWSCDLLPAEDGSPFHIQADICDLLCEDWDVGLFFPPCTHLACSGAKHFKEKRADGRQQEGINFFMAMITADIQKIAVENPVGIMSTVYRKPNQLIQPYQFGHRESKKTCLWLKGLPMLTPTQIMEPLWHKNIDGTDYRDNRGHRYSEQHYNPQAWAKARYGNQQTPSGQNRWFDRARIRSRTYQGIADAMAEQWS